MRILIVIILNTLLISLSLAQEKKFIRRGNSAYKTQDYDNSELNYRKALEKKPNSFDAGFDLGDALFRQKKYEEAIKQFENLARSETSKDNKAKAYHNLGNTYMVSKDEQQQPRYKEAVEAYKNALRNNPKDDETRYNLAYAQKMLKQQQQQQKQNQDKDKNKDKKDDKKNKDEKNKDQQNKDNKDKQDKDKQDKEKNKDQQNKPQDQKEKQKQEQKKQQIPKDKAEQMLKALENDEKDLQKKMKMQKVKGKKVKVEKDW